MKPLPVVPLYAMLSFSVNNGDWKEYNPDNKPVISNDFSGIITVRVTDNAGNVSDYAESNEILVQTTKVFAIKEPSRTSIRCNDSITIHTEITGIIPDGAYVEWIANNEKFNVDESEDGMNITITSKNNGNTTFTAILYDADGNVIGIDKVEMYSKAGFFDKIGGFFRSLFGSTVHYDS